MHWKKIIPVVFFGIFLVSLLAASPIYAQQDDDKSSKESKLFAWFDEETAAFIGILVAIIVYVIGFAYQAREFRKGKQEQNLAIVEGYSSQITELKNKERALQTKHDCETYAQNYLDLMDQIAFLCIENRGIPKGVRKYFENDFAYALTIMWWLKEHNLIKKESLELLKDFFKEPDKKYGPDNNPDRENTTEIYIADDYMNYGIKKLEEKYKEKAVAFPWHDLIRWCLDKTDKELITPFDDDQLPDSMYFYDQLHEDDIEGTLKIVQEYGAKLIELTKKEPELKNVLEWETYASVYLDTLDSIAYLLLKNIIPKGVDQYFENNFSYGLTMLKWLEKNKLVDEITITPEKKDVADKKEKIAISMWLEQRTKAYKDYKVDKEYPWSDFLNWCKDKEIEDYGDSYLPKKMLNPDPE